ncbi:MULTISPECIES: response regulator [Undibacterium]|uniref:Response regulator transcription factor n=1 Tax=Undibacterium umbellatum TaxID=2762300 RepID=A0ABR6Z568_9BURK|nr:MULTISPECIES: response regulator transcription factor [Undibacterium]MBC3906915.1 response regulator transcription factor [Undibacterium umbellatum]MDP1976522.1 response regulator transcription factor [Undibacterium sp.]
MEKKNAKILLIDDNDVTREVLRVILRSEGYNVVGEATDGGSGLELALKLKPDLIMLDIVMPKISGTEILPRIRDLLPDTRVLMVTANKDQETITEVVKTGIHGYILKPFNAQKIIDTVAGVVGKINR